METKEQARKEIPSDVMDEAAELARGAIIEPNGVLGLAEKIQEARLQNRKLRVKLGIDPTSKHLHFGHTVVMRKLRRFKEFGHDVFLVIGGFTAQIGDPTGRDTTRPVQTPEQVQENSDAFLAQIGVILQLEPHQVLNNADWLEEKGMLSKLALLGRRISVNKIMARFSERLKPDSPNPPNWTETMYPLLQGFDSVHMRADVEIGGTDQCSNLFMGRDLQQFEGQSPQVVMMLDLLEGIDGDKKMSKSLGNAISLTDNPEEMFGKCMSMADNIKAKPGKTPVTGSLILKFLELGTGASAQEVAAESAFIAAGGNPRDAKERLATRIVTEIHGTAAAEKELEKWQRKFVARLTPEEMPSLAVPTPTAIVLLMVEAGLANGNDSRPSKSQARRLIQGGAVKLDSIKVTEPDLIVEVQPGASRELKVGKNFRLLVNEKVAS